MNGKLRKSENEMNKDIHDSMTLTNFLDRHSGVIFLEKRVLERLSGKGSA